MKKKFNLLCCSLVALLAACGTNPSSESAPASEETPVSQVPASEAAVSEGAPSEAQPSPEVSEGEPSEAQPSPEVSEEAPSPAHVHEFGEWSTTKAPTCVADGEQKRSCACGETETEPISKLSTNGKHAVTRASALLDENGQYVYECSVCGGDPATTFVDFDPDKDFTEFKWGTWEVSQDKKTISGLNKDTGDQHWVTNLCPGEDDNLILELDVKGSSLQVDFAANIGLGIAAPNDPGATWMGFNLSFPNTNCRVFGKNVDQDDTRCRLVDYGIAGFESYHIRIEALASKWISYYVNDKPIAIFECPDYNGGYISLCTWLADVEFSNIRYYIGKDLPMTAGMFAGAHEGKVSVAGQMNDGCKWGNWTVEQENTVIHAVNEAGNLFYVSNVQVDADDEFVLETDIKTRDTCGVVIVPNQTDPGAAWLCQNVNWDSSRAFVEGGANTIVGLESTYKVYEHQRSYSVRHIKITVTNTETEGTKHLKFEACGILIHECDVTGYTGGYIGFMTWNGESYFFNPTISFID